MYSICKEGVKARKAHRCLWCRQRIEKGELYVREWVADGNEHHRNAYHTECFAAIQAAGHEYIDYWNDEGCPEQQRGHSHEFGYTEPGCPGCANNTSQERWTVE